MIPAQPGFGFEQPVIAAAAVLILAGGYFLSRRLGSPFAASIPLGAPGGVPFKAPVNLRGLVRLLRALEYCGLLLLFAAAAGPVIKIPETVWLNRGADILFILDISPSMAAIDMNGASRYNAARNLLKNFAVRRPSDSIGIVAVGKDAALLVPPTMDRAVLNARLDSLQTGELGDGTALGSGLAVAAYHLEKSRAQRRAAVLISDGENNAGSIHPLTAAGMFRDLGITLYVIGIGSGGEVPIDYVDPFTRMRHTGLYDSHYDTESLRSISAEAGGTWIHAASADALVSAFSLIDDHEMVIRRSGIITRSRPCQALFLLLGLALVTVSVFVRRFFLGAWL